MIIDIVVGAQWGDEGKGKVCQNLCQGADICARFQGGANAGHTVIIGGEEVVFRQIPTGIISANHGYMGPGMAINIPKFMKEYEILCRILNSDSPPLCIAAQAHVVVPEYIMFERNNMKRIGTTLNGIGPTYSHKAARDGIRIGELKDPGVYEKIIENCDRDEQEMYRTFMAIYDQLVVDHHSYISSQYKDCNYMVAEGAQGVLLDIDLGEYPFVTSSNTTPGYAISSLSLNVSEIHNIFLVTSAYMTKVGGGELPTQMDLSTERKFQEQGLETDGATNKMRNCGWLDIDKLKRAVNLAKPTLLVVTRLDVIAAVGICKVHCKNEIYTFSVDGWASYFKSKTAFDSAPQSLKEFLNFIELNADCKVGGFSFGRSVDDLVWKNTKVLTNV